MDFKSAIFLIMVLCSSCTNSLEERSKHNIENEILTDEIKFQKLYHQKSKLLDSESRISLEQLNIKIIHSKRFIEEAENRIKNFRKDNTGNIEDVSALLVNTSLGDSLFSSLISFFETAIELAKSQKTRQKIELDIPKIFKNKNVKELESHYFGLISGEGALILLKNGFYNGLYITSYDVLSDY